MTPTTSQTICAFHAPSRHGADVRLAGGKHDREAVQREEHGRDDERQVDVDAPRRRASAGVLDRVVDLACGGSAAMIFVASPADVAPSNVTSGTMTTTTIFGSSAGAMPANHA